MICGKCDQPIRPGQAYTSHDIHSASGAGTTIHRHAEDEAPDETARPTDYASGIQDGASS